MADVIITPVSESVFNVSVTVSDPDVAALANQATEAAAVAVASAASAEEDAIAAEAARVETEIMRDQILVIYQNIQDTINSQPGYDVFLLVGQSNMVGKYGPIDPVLDATDPRIFQYGIDGQTVVIAENPLDHHDEGAGSVGMGLTFAKQYLANSGITSNRNILLVPAADSGTSFYSGFWRDGGVGNDTAIAQANAAMTQGNGFNRFKGILWHQGESDSSSPTTSAIYRKDLSAFANRVRSQVTGAQEAPFLVGGLLQSRYSGGKIQVVLEDAPNFIEFSAYVSSLGLVDGGDELHFDAASQRTFGERYYAKLADAVANEFTPSIPDDIDDLQAFEGDGEVFLSHTAPLNRTDPILDYNYYYRATGSGTWILFNDGTSATPGTTVTGLTNGQEYEFYATATNIVGTNNPSNIVTSTPEEPADALEVGAAGHWLFGIDNPTMADLVSGQLATPANATPAQASGYLTTANSNYSGLITPFPATKTQTFCFVTRSAGAGSYVVGGSLTATSSEGGSGIQFASANGDVIGNTRGPGANTFKTGRALNSFVFVALTLNGSNQASYFYGDTPHVFVNSSVATITNITPARNVGIGNVHYGFGSYINTGLDFAEAIVFNGQKTEAELLAIYERSKIRMADRGITLI